MAKSVTASSDRRTKRRLQHQDLSRAQLLDAAERIFGQRGFHETTLKEVAERAGFSVGSVYSFFENKDDLFRQVFLRRGQEYMPAMRVVLVDGDPDPLDQLHRLVDFEVGFFRQHPHFGRLFLWHAGPTLRAEEPDMDPAISENFEEAMVLQAALFERGQRAGVFREGDPVVLGRLLSGLVSAYQALDPAVVDDGTEASERFPLNDLHAIVESAFRA